MPICTRCINVCGRLLSVRAAVACVLFKYLISNNICFACIAAEDTQRLRDSLCVHSYCQNRASERSYMCVYLFCLLKNFSMAHEFLLLLLLLLSWCYVRYNLKH